MKRTGSTHMDLVATIFILFIVILLTPACIQQAREAARQMQCANNLKILSLAALNHESVTRAYPSGGWNVNYVGDPDRGFGAKQPGSWTFSLLPFMEQNSLFQLGSTGNAQSCEKKENSTVLETPLTFFTCPSRRVCKTFPLDVTEYQNSNFSGSQGAKCDYAANYGTTEMKIGTEISYETPDEEILAPEDSMGMFPGARLVVVIPRKDHPTGVIFDVSAVTIGEIRDGTSNTYLIGEKFVYRDQYEQAGPGDKASMYAGIADDDSNSIFRSAGVMETNEWYLPTQDASQAKADQGAWRGFGSAHADSFGMAMCDGSVQRISYEIDGETSARLADRKDGHLLPLPE